MIRNYMSEVQKYIQANELRSLTRRTVIPCANNTTLLRIKEFDEERQAKEAGRNYRSLSRSLYRSKLLSQTAEEKAQYRSSDEGKQVGFIDGMAGGGIGSGHPTLMNMAT